MSEGFGEMIKNVATGDGFLYMCPKSFSLPHNKRYSMRYFLICLFFDDVFCLTRDCNISCRCLRIYIILSVLYERMNLVYPLFYSKSLAGVTVF